MTESAIERLLRLAHDNTSCVEEILRLAGTDSDGDNDADEDSESAEAEDNENMLNSGVCMGPTGVVSYGAVHLGHVAPSSAGKGFVGTHVSGVKTKKMPTRAKAAMALRELHHYVPKEKHKSSTQLISMSNGVIDQIITLGGDAPGNGKKPYGNVRYADPRNGKYPIDTEEHCRAAWAYINKPKNAAVYPLNGVSLSSVKAKIKAACKRFGIDISEDN